MLTDFLGGHAQSLQENSHGLLTLTVDANTHLVLLVDLELQPCTTAGNNANGMNFLVAEFVQRGVEVHTGTTHQLRHHDTLGAVDDEGSLFGHQGEVTHEHCLGLDFTGEVVHEFCFDIERSGIGLATLLALVE